MQNPFGDPAAGTSKRFEKGDFSPRKEGKREVVQICTPPREKICKSVRKRPERDLQLPRGGT